MRCPAILTGQRSWLFARLVGNGVAQAAASLAVALLVQSAFNEVTGDTPLSLQRALVQLGGGLVVVGFAIGWLRFRERIDAERLGQDYTHDLRLLLFRQLAGLSPRSLQNRSHGGILLRFVGDLTAVRQWVSLGLARLTVAGTTALGALFALALLNWVLMLATGIVLTLAACAAYLVGRAMPSAVSEVRRHHSRMASNISEKLAAMPVVQVFGQTSREEKRLAGQSQQYGDARIERARVSGRLRAVTEAAYLACLGVILFAGLFEAAHGRATPGAVVGAMTVAGMILPSLRDLNRAHEYWHNAQVSFARIRDFAAAPAPLRKRSKLPKLNAEDGVLTFQGVSAGDVLKDLDLCAPAGARVSIVGPNGSGKTTLLWLAAGLVRPDAGAVLIDGQDLATLDPSSIRGFVGMVSPDLPLLRGSIARNLRYRCPKASQADLDQVRSLCGLDEALAGLPDGEETRLSAGGTNLSLGQRQRVMLARALIGAPLVLLLDEVDAHLDVQAAEIIARIVESYSGTILMVTHRREQIARADVVWRIGLGGLVTVEPPGAQALQADMAFDEAQLRKSAGWQSDATSAAR